MNIGLFGGSFSPPHAGHIHTAIVTARFFDEVWVIPCFSHTLGKKLIDNKHRLAMCELAFQNIDKIRVEDFEIKYQLSDGTLESVRTIKKIKPKNKYTVIIGQDNADSIDSWRNAAQLIKEVPFMVVPRTGYCRNFNDTAWYVLEHHQYLRDLPNMQEIPPHSSTTARKTISLGKKPEELSESVWNYIIKNNLYSSA